MGEERYRRLTVAEAAAQVGEPWTVSQGCLVATFRTGSMVRGLDFVTAVVEAAEQADHHPDIDFRYGTVGLTLSTHAVDGLTDADVALADTVSRIASEAGIDPQS